MGIRSIVAVWVLVSGCALPEQGRGSVEVVVPVEVVEPVGAGGYDACEVPILDPLGESVDPQSPHGAVYEMCLRAADEAYDVCVQPSENVFLACEMRAEAAARMCRQDANLPEEDDGTLTTEQLAELEACQEGLSLAGDRCAAQFRRDSAPCERMRQRVKNSCRDACLQAIQPQLS